MNKLLAFIACVCSPVFAMTPPPYPDWQTGNTPKAAPFSYPYTVHTPDKKVHFVMPDETMRKKPVKKTGKKKNFKKKKTVRKKTVEQQMLEQITSQWIDAVNLYYNRVNSFWDRKRLNQTADRIVAQLRLLNSEKTATEWKHWLFNQPVTERGDTLAHLAAFNLDQELLRMAKINGNHMMRVNNNNQRPDTVAHERKQEKFAHIQQGTSSERIQFERFQKFNTLLTTYIMKERIASQNTSI